MYVYSHITHVSTKPNQSAPAPSFPREIKKWTHGPFTYRSGIPWVAEIHNPPLHQASGRFIGVRKLIQRHDRGSSGVFAQGPIFERNGQLRGILPLKLNEVAIVEESGEVCVEKLGRPRLLTMTNETYPKHVQGISVPKYASRAAREAAKDDLEKTGRLVCRWRVTRAASKAKADGASIERLRPEEVPEAYRVSELTLWKTWRRSATLRNPMNEGPTPESTPEPRSRAEMTPPRTSLVEEQDDLDCYIIEPEDDPNDEVVFTGERPRGHLFSDDDIAIVDEYEANGFEIVSSASMDGREDNGADSPDPEVWLAVPEKYTFGDGFCGGGGMGSGAFAAGFNLKWAFDHDPKPVETYRQNFPGSHVYKKTVFDFLKTDSNITVDVLHLSPPCQPHSPAHTIAGRNDDANEAAGLCIPLTLDKARPRVATLEQTFGILNRAREAWFYAMINSFTAEGWNVRWRVLKCVEFGIPQLRKRLIVIASCPGERLPDWPEPRWRDPTQKTIDCELRRPRTLRDTIGAGVIPPTARHQSLQFFRDGEREPKSKWDTPLTHTVLAGGGAYDIHPDRVRRFTVRELACIQTFPHTHNFVGSPVDKKKQIGNAVPPLFAQQILRSVRKSLESEDKRREVETAEWERRKDQNRKRNLEEMESREAEMVECERRKDEKRKRNLEEVERNERAKRNRELIENGESVNRLLLVDLSSQSATESGGSDDDARRSARSSCTITGDTPLAIDLG